LARSIVINNRFFFLFSFFFVFPCFSSHKFWFGFCLSFLALSISISVRLFSSSWYVSNSLSMSQKSLRSRLESPIGSSPYVRHSHDTSFPVSFLSFFFLALFFFYYVGVVSAYW
jgi:hypothetical protein